MNVFKRKSVSTYLELMYTCSTYGTPDLEEQGRLLNEISRHVDAGTLRTTMMEQIFGINAANLRRVHAQVESGTTHGKIVLKGFGAAA